MQLVLLLYSLLVAGDPRTAGVSVERCRAVFGSHLTDRDCFALRELAQQAEDPPRSPAVRLSEQVDNHVDFLADRFVRRCRRALGRTSSRELCLRVQFGAIALDRDWQVFHEHLPPCPGDLTEAESIARTVRAHEYVVGGDVVRATIAWGPVTGGRYLLRDHPGAEQAIRGWVREFEVAGPTREFRREKADWGIQCTMDARGRLITAEGGAASGSADRHRLGGGGLANHMRVDVDLFHASWAEDRGDLDGRFVSAYRDACPTGRMQRNSTSRPMTGRDRRQPQGHSLSAPESRRVEQPACPRSAGCANARRRP